MVYVCRGVRSDRGGYAGCDVIGRVSSVLTALPVLVGFEVGFVFAAVI